MIYQLTGNEKFSAIKDMILSNRKRTIQLCTPHRNTPLPSLMGTQLILTECVCGSLGGLHVDEGIYSRGTP